MITISIWCECSVFKKIKISNKKPVRKNALAFPYGPSVFLCDIRCSMISAFG